MKRHDLRHKKRSGEIPTPNNGRSAEQQFKKIYDQLDSKEITAFERIKARKRRKKRMKRWALLLFLLVGICGTVYLLSPLSEIKAVAIVGNKTVPKEEVERMLDVKIGDNIHFVQALFLNRSIEANPFISHVDVVKNKNNQIELQVSERRAVYRTVKGEKVVAYFEDGTFAEIPDSYRVDAPLLVDAQGGDAFPYEELAKRLAVVPSEIVAEISEIKHTPTAIEAHRFTLYMKDRNRVIILMNKIDTQLKYYFKLLEMSDSQRREYVMEYSDSVFARLIKE